MPRRHRALAFLGLRACGPGSLRRARGRGHGRSSHRPGVGEGVACRGAGRPAEVWWAQKSHTGTLSVGRELTLGELGLRACATPPLHCTASMRGPGRLSKCAYPNWWDLTVLGAVPESLAFRRVRPRGHFASARASWSFVSCCCVHNLQPLRRFWVGPVAAVASWSWPGNPAGERDKGGSLRVSIPASAVIISIQRASRLCCTGRPPPRRHIQCRLASAWLLTPCWARTRAAQEPLLYASLSKDASYALPRPALFFIFSLRRR